MTAGCPRCGTLLDPDGTCMNGCSPLGNAAATTGAALLDELEAALIRYVVLPSAHATVAAVLWTAATHAQQAWETATRLVATSPEKRCGKSRLLDIIEAACHAALMTVNISPAALVRSIGNDPPTLLLDEADTVFGKKAADNHEDLRGLLNAGHQQNRPYVRWDAAARQAESCPTFAMAALAGIGSLPDTITDRAVVISMRRRAAGEPVSAWRQRRDRPAVAAIGERLHEWARDHLTELQESEPASPVDDRAADNWEPLLAIADLAGADWPARARAACLALTTEADTDTSTGVRLLADLRAIWDGSEAMHGAEILARLHKIEEAPWADWYGKPLAYRDLARLLKPYGIKPVKVKVGGTSLQGYRRAPHIADAWSRYLVPDGTCGTVQVDEPPEVPGSGSVPEPGTWPPLATCAVPEVPQVPDTPCGVCGEALYEADQLAGAVAHAQCEEQAT